MFWCRSLVNVWCGDFFLLIIILVLPEYVVNETLRRAASSTERRLTGACLRLPASAAFRCIWLARLPFYSSALHFIHFCSCTPERLSIISVRSLSSLSLSLARSFSHSLAFSPPTLPSLPPPSFVWSCGLCVAVSQSLLHSLPSSCVSSICAPMNLEYCTNDKRAYAHTLK